MSLSALEAIARIAKECPHSPALRDQDGQRISYSTLVNLADELSACLRRSGLVAEDVVAVLLPASALQVIAVVGTLNTCACAPLQVKSNTEEIGAWLRRISAAALILTEESEAEANMALAMGLTVFCANASLPPSLWQIRRSPASRIGRRAASNAVLYLVTSGTTNTSKIIPLSAQNLNAGIEARSTTLKLSSGDRLLQMTSMCHIIGVENTFAQFLAGGEVIATTGFDPIHYIEWLEKYQPTWYDCSPTIHQAALAQLRRKPPLQTHSLRLLQSAGAPLPDDARRELEDILQIPVFNDYGMTEACPIAVDAFLPDERVPKSAGRSCGLEISILNAKGERVLPGVHGEIAVRGPALFSGYLDQPEADQAAFYQGCFRTGDAGYLDEHGNLFVIGRLKEMINRGGEKIAPSEIDDVINAHPAVLDAASFAIPHPTLGENVACAVVLRNKPQSATTAVELRRFAARHLPAHKVPHHIRFVDAIPRGELGKPQRWVLAERSKTPRPLPVSPDDVTAHLYADGGVFLHLHEMWSRILDRDDLGFDEDFFEAGGDSLAAINLLAEVDIRFGSQTSAQAAAFLDEPTLQQLTRLVGVVNLPEQDDPASHALRVFPVRQSTSSLRIFCVPADQEEGLYFRRLAAHLAGSIDLSIVRPENTRFGQNFFSLENAGRALAALLRKTQPDGPYLIAGYCYGGVVAYEAARHLATAPTSVRLILFDVPMPGFPTLVAGARIWLRRARLELDMARRGNIRTTMSNFSRFAARLAWSLLVPLRRLLVPLQKVAAFRRFMRWVQIDDFPVYRATPLDVPILHFLCADEPHMIQRESRYGWRKMATRGIHEHVLPHDHPNIFHESNLPAIGSAILDWIGDSSESK
jgi:oxalate---CoA ligase